MKILISGGAGFVGSRLAVMFKEASANNEVVALDNLRRRGSEHNLPAFRRMGIQFHHGDIRQPDDLNELTGSFDVLIDASAEPSVMAGLSGSPSYVLHTNLTGTLNLLEYARRNVGTFVFLSTSKVYSIQPLRALPLNEESTRLSFQGETEGATRQGISERFPTCSARSLYGATKLASEQIIQEFSYLYGMKSVINRCGILAGAGQFGKVDQGVFTLWAIHHYFGKPLRYTGFGGHGKQVRDLLHPRDLFTLIQKQLEKVDQISGEIFNVGGGLPRATSLLELTRLCRELTGKEVPISSEPAESTVDVPWYVTDSAKASRVFDWRPQIEAKAIVQEVLGWLKENEASLKPLFA